MDSAKKNWKSWVRAALLGRFFSVIPAALRARCVVELMESLTIEERRNAIARMYARGQMRDRQSYPHPLWESRRTISAAKPRNVVVGAGGTGWEGWVSLESEVLDITKSEDWEVLFDPMSVDRILMEHVLEHLDERECHAALALCHKYLRAGGLLRIAVPDGFRRDETYRVEVEPPKDGHRMLFDKDSLSIMLKEHGFQVELLEYFDENDTFHAHAWDESEGLVRRSIRFDQQVEFRRGDLFYTSLIVDAQKRADCGAL